MRSFWATGILSLLLLAGCAETKTESPNFGNVPGPSQTKAVLPPPPAVEPVAAPAPKSKPAPAEKRKPVSTNTPAPIVTPDTSLIGKVARFNDAGRFVVLVFPISHMPAAGQRLFLYRGGLKVGEVKVTGPQRDDRTVADLTTGEAQTGDEAREQ